MKYALSTVPMAANQMVARCSFFGRRSQPEDPQAEEGRLQEERQQAFDGQRRPKMSPTNRL